MLVPKVVVVDLFVASSFNAKAAVVAVAFAVTVFPRVVIAAVFAVFEVEIFVSTYVFTAFCVGNNTLLVPKDVVVDLFPASSFKAKAAVVAVAFEVTVFPRAVIAAVFAVFEAEIFVST